MGYVLKPSAIARVKPLLDEMVASDRDCSWPSDDPRLAYYLREAIAAAKQLSIVEYAGLSGKFIIRSSKGRVTAELRNKLAIEQLIDSTARMTLHEIRFVAEVVGASIKHKAREMYFPDFVLSDDEEDKEALDKLSKWASSAGYEILNHEAEGITLRRA